MNINISDILAIPFGILTYFIIEFGKKLLFLGKTRRSRKFWKPFEKEVINIYLTEYRTGGNDLDNKTAQRASDGYLVSKGNAQGMSNIVNGLTEYITNRSNIKVYGDKSGMMFEENLIVLGSTANNKMTQHITKRLNERYNIPFEIDFNTESGEIDISLKNSNVKFDTLIDEDGFGVDYAIIIKAPYRTSPKKYALILSGAYMYGTQAATHAIFNEEIINKVVARSKGSGACAFLIRTSVANFEPSAPEIEFEKSTYIYHLKERIASEK